MGAHLPNWSKNVWPAVKSDVFGRGPLFLMSGCALALVGWAAGVSSQPPADRSGFFSPFSILIIVFLGVGIILWVVKKVHDYNKDPSQYTIADVIQRQDGLKDLLVAKGNEAPISVGDTLTAPRGAIITRAVGVGPVVLTVPSNGMFGVSPDKTIQVILPDDVTSFVLPDGGTVAAQLRATINIVSTVKGDLTIGNGKEE
jgi:hypothetical protein